MTSMRHDPRRDIDRQQGMAEDRRDDGAENLRCIAHRPDDPACGKAFGNAIDLAADDKGDLEHARDDFHVANVFDIDLWHTSRIGKARRLLAHVARGHRIPRHFSMGDLVGVAFSNLNYTAGCGRRPTSFLTSHIIVNRLHPVTCGRKTQRDTTCLSEPVAAARNSAATGSSPHALGEMRRGDQIPFCIEYGAETCMDKYLLAWRAPRKSSDKKRHALTKLSVERSGRSASFFGLSKLPLTSAPSATAASVMQLASCPASLRHLARSSPRSWSNSQRKIDCAGKTLSRGGSIARTGLPISAHSGQHHDECAGTSSDGRQQAIGARPPRGSCSATGNGSHWHNSAIRNFSRGGVEGHAASLQCTDSGTRDADRIPAPLRRALTATALSRAGIKPGPRDHSPSTSVFMRSENRKQGEAA